MQSVFFKLFVILINIFIFSVIQNNKAAANESDESEEQDLLFLLEEGYTQEKGEWQLGLGYQNLQYKQTQEQKKALDNTWVFNVEYGITDRLQVELSLPYQKSRWYESTKRYQASALGNPEFEVAYQVVQQSQSLPAVSIGFGIEIGAGEKEPIRSDNWRYEVSLHTSKHINELGFIHTSFAYETSDNGDETELGYGLGFVYPFSDTFSGMIEYFVEHEAEENKGVKEKEKVALLSLGVTFQNDDGFIVGLAYGLSDDKQFLDQSITMKLQYEF